MSVISIIAKFIDQTKAGTQSAKRNLDQLDKSVDDNSKSSKSFTDNWSTMLLGINQGIQIAQTAARAMQQIYSTAREGADLEYAAGKFDNLAKSIGTTADALMGDLREATQGMYSDAELMASAGDFMALGLAKSRDEVVRLSNVAGALNMNMNQLVLTLTNQTTMRFDALGVSVDGFDEKVKELEESGMSAQDAFSEAFLQQAEEQIDKVGSAADSTKGAFLQLEAAVQNGTNNMKMQLAEVLAPAVGALAEKMNDARNAQDDLRTAQELGIITQEDFNRLASHEGMRRYGDEIDDVSEKVDEFTGNLNDNIEANRYAKDAYYQNTDALIDFYKEIRTAAQETKELADATYNYAKDSLKDLGVELDDKTYLADMMALAFGDITLEEIEMREATENATDAFYDGYLTAPEYIAALEDIAEGANEVMTAGGLAAGAVWTLSEALGSLPREKRVDILVETYYTQTGSSPVYTPPDFGGGSGGVGPGEGGPQALGGFYGTNRPTSFRTSEYGQPETAIFIPQGKSIYDVATPAQVDKIMPRGGKTVNNYFNLTMPTTANPADMVTMFDLMQSWAG